MVKLLIEEGKADIDAAGEGMTPLAWATWYQNIELMTYLIGAGASVNAQSSSLFNESILFWAVQRHNTQAAMLLLNFRYADNDPCVIAEKAFISKFGKRAPKEKKPKTSMLSMLTGGGGKGKGRKGSSLGRGRKASSLGGGARSGSSGSRSVSKSKSPVPGQTDKATGKDKKKKDDDDDDDDDKSSDEEEEKKESGCNPDMPCRNGATPLLLLMRHSQVYPAEEKLPLAELLIARGADVNVISTDKMTPLLWAVLNVQGPLVKLLISHGMLLCR